MNCTVCEKPMSGLVCGNRWCQQEHVECVKCREVISTAQAYEYRGALSCSTCFEAVQEGRDFERQEIMEEERHKTDCFRGLDVSSNTVIGRANRAILKQNIEIASKESLRLRRYERQK